MSTARARKHSLRRAAGLRRELAESKAAFAALVNGQVDSIIDPAGPLLLREAQAALHRSEENFRALIEQLPDQVWVHQAGRVIYVNRTTVRSLGYAPPELIGEGLLELVLPEDRELVRARLAAGLEVGKQTERFEARVRCRDGNTVVLQLSAQGVLFDGQPATLAVAHDITTRKDLEAQLVVRDRMASIGMLAAGVAHEINNPLAYVIANLHFVEAAVIKQQTLGPCVALDEAATAIAEAQEGAERVKGIVRDLKAFARSEEPERGTVDLHQVLDSAANLAANELRHCARLVKDYSRDRLTVEGSASRLGQVFVNLLVNAAHAIPAGAADHHEIRLVTRAQEDGRALVEVRDTGPGMSPEVLKQLFTPFFTTKPKGIGTGLGLSICQKIVAAHGGEIQVRSELGRGTTFKVFLNAAVPVKRVGLVGAPLPMARRGRVLVVDDEPLLGKAIRRVLEPHHDADVVSSGKDALLTLASGAHYDAILCDLMMPEMSGPQVYEAIVARHPSFAHRIAFISGGAFTESARKFVEQVTKPTIAKPFELRQMLVVLAQLMA